jgi:uncharacterized delta-60 repeat protein
MTLRSPQRTILSVERLEDRCLLSGGVLDPTFGSGGVVTTAFPPGDAEATAVAVYPNAGTANDSKIVAAGGFVSRSGGGVLALARYNANGFLDTSFGSAGTVTTALGKGNWAQAIAIQSDGKVLAAGWVFQQNDNYDFALTRYNSNGSLDTSFGNKGVVTTNLTGSAKSASADYANAIVVQPDGKIILAGTSTTGIVLVPANNNIALARYNSNGSLDTSFGSGGKVITSYLSLPGSVGNTSVDSVALEPDGTIVVFGASQLAGGVNHPFVARYTSSGVLDSTFGGTGIVVLTQVSLIQYSRSYPAQVAGVVQGDGSIVVEGPDATSGSADLARLNLNGSLDPTFGTGGIAYEAGFHVAPYHPTIALQSDGKFVLATGLGGSQTVRLLSNGTLDTTFGTNGVSVAPPVPILSEAVAIQPNGEIVMVGRDNLNIQDFAVARFLAAGPQIGSFTASPNPVTAGSSLTLTASNITDEIPSATITQVALYYYDGTGTKVTLGTVSQSTGGAWTLTSPTAFGLTAGTYTIYAQAEDSYGIFGDPFTITLTVQ